MHIFERLQRGEAINTQEEMERFNVSRKTIQRYIKELRNYLEETFTYDANAEIIYDRTKQGYILKREEDNWLSKEEILILAKVLLESRAFMKDEMDKLLDKLILQAVPEEQDQITEVIKNERFHYTPVKHEQLLAEKVWGLSELIRKKRITTLEYNSSGRDGVAEHEVKPVGVIFSDFYFYLIAYMYNRDYDHPTVFRIDRIKNYEAKDEKFRIPYRERFKAGEFRKRVQFMYSGDLSRVKFRYRGGNPQYILDRLPTAEIINKEDKAVIIKAEVYSEYGLKMWILSQAKTLEVLEPESLRKEIRELITDMLEIYD